MERAVLCGGWWQCSSYPALHGRGGFRFSQIQTTEQSRSVLPGMVWREGSLQLWAVLMKVTLVISRRWARGAPGDAIDCCVWESSSTMSERATSTCLEKRELQGNQHGSAANAGQGCGRAALISGNNTPKLPQLSARKLISGWMICISLTTNWFWLVKSSEYQPD